ncbi:MAG: SIMPL domain-containing protein [Calditrichia bacterium]|nr:SIMPL domain-containing protein [Calditrichia bacterium]
MKILLIIIIGLFCIGCQTNDAKLISIRGDAKIEVEPNIAYLTIIASHTSKSTQKAMEAVSNKLHDVVKIAKEHNIQDKQIQTSKINLQKSYQWIRNSNVFKGYTATSDITLEINDLKNIERTIGTLIEVPKIEIRNFHYFHTDYDSIKNVATLDALENAKKLANEVCLKEGLKLDGIESFSNHSRVENKLMSYSDDYGVLQERAEYKSKRKTSSFTIKPGVVFVNSTVYVDFRALNFK